MAVETCDILDFASRWYRLIFVHGYNYISAKLPKFWGWLYHHYNDQSHQALAVKISQWAVERRFIAHIKSTRPDFIIATHPLPMIIVSQSKRRDVIEILSSIVVTDYGCHSFWVDPEVNYYFVATPDVAQCLRGVAVPAEKIVVTGIPIHQKFSKVLDRAALQKKFSLHSDRSTVLIVGGQFSFDALRSILQGIEQNVGAGVQFLIVAGRDAALKEALDRSDLGKNPQVRVFGFVDNMEEIMTAADLIFSKAGGLTVSECMAKGLPMVIHQVIPGQEEDNVSYLVSRGAALKAENVSEIITSVTRLLKEKKKLAAMQHAAVTIGKPRSAFDLATFVYERITK